ncbi:MAG: D-alanine-D-alanine ligase [Solirubrobacteraceae bacterium]|nr:D-alanine-D-alanine ligase [Solirubrobacteraceae bacterium]
MEIGIAYDLAPQATGPWEPNDLYEEYDSAATVDAVADALGRLGHDVRHLGGGRSFLRAMLDGACELVFNMAEGEGSRSREAHVPAVCEMLAIPYTHSDPLTLAAALDKAVAKTLVAAAGIPTPAFAVLECPGEDVTLRFPLIAKPVAEGSSMGLRSSSRVTDAPSLRAHVMRLIDDYAQPVLVEEFCPGPEFTVAIVGTGADATPLGIMEIVPRRGQLAEFVYSTEIKRASAAAVHYRVPPEHPARLVQRAVEVAIGAYRTLGCRDLARVDVRVDAAGEPSFLEINALPGLRPGWGDVTILAERYGVTFDELVGGVVCAARARLGI